jgi:hypothetical protein
VASTKDVPPGVGLGECPFFEGASVLHEGNSAMTRDRQARDAAPLLVQRVMRRMAWVLGGVAVVTMALAGLLALKIRANAITGDLRRPPADLARAIGGASLVSASRAANDKPAPWPAAAALPETFEQYVQLQADRGYRAEGARLYLELIKTFNRGFQNSWHMIFENVSYDDGKPLTDAQRQWLAAQGDVLGLIHRMIVVGGPPLPTAQDMARVDLKRLATFPMFDFRVLATSGRMLAVEARRRREAGDLDGAVNCLADVVALSRVPRDQLLIGGLLSVALRARAMAVLQEWIEASRPAEPTLRRLMAIADEASGDEPALDAGLANEYAMGRATLASLLGGPLLVIIRCHYETIYNRWGGSYDPPYDSSLSSIVDQFRKSPTQLTMSMAVAIWGKANAQEILSAYDDCWRERLTCAKTFRRISQINPLATMEKTQRSAPFDVNWYWVNSIMPNFTLGDARSYAAEARANLCRAALRMALGEPFGGDDRAATMTLAGAPAASADRRSPWRDPFTDAPLVLDATTSPALLYSLGPDLKDQRGLLAYDPTNGALSPGDIALRLPFRVSP